MEKFVLTLLDLYDGEKNGYQNISIPQWRRPK